MSVPDTACQFWWRSPQWSHQGSEKCTMGEILCQSKLELTNLCYILMNTIPLLQFCILVIRFCVTVDVFYFWCALLCVSEACAIVWWLAFRSSRSAVFYCKYRYFSIPFVSEILKFSTSNNGVSLKARLGVIQGYWTWHHSIDRIRVRICLAF